MYKLAIFDLDGTILYTLKQLNISFNIALGSVGLPGLDIDTFKGYVGNGARKLVERSAPDSDDDIREKILSDYRTYYNAHCTENTYPYDGIVDLMKTMRDQGMRIAVVTNKSDSTSKILMDHFFPELIDEVRGHREGVHHKPDPTLVNEVLTKLDISPEESVYIGDSDVDILTAVYSNMPCISVTWGYRSREFLIENGAKTMVDNCEELKSQLGL